MSGPALTRAQHEAAARAGAFVADYVREAEFRWPDLSWRDAIEPSHQGRPAYRFIDGRWTVDGHEHGLRTTVPMDAEDVDVLEAKQEIASCAIYRDELRKGAKP
jgi:hypothetical protein